MSSNLPKFAGRRKGVRPAFVYALSLGTAGALAMVTYLAATSLPFLASSPTTDPSFGELNQCLLEQLGEIRVGFAVAPDGRFAASYDGASIALCERAVSASPEAISRADGFKLPLSGIAAAAFDFSGTLWLATGRRAGGESGLFRLTPPKRVLERIGDLAPIALAGHASGIAAVEASGRVVSLGREGQALRVAQLPSPPEGGAQLESNADGSLLAVVAGTGLFVYRAADLSRVSAEGPCQVEFLWWQREPTRAVVSCAPNASWALWLDLRSGDREAAPRRQRVRSELVQRMGLYVQACEHLPCSAPDP